MLLNCGVGEDSWESLGLQGEPTVNPKGNQSWIFIGRADAEAETPILGPPDAKSWITGKDPDAGKDWRQEEKGMTEDEMVGWHHGLNGHEFEQAPGAGDGQGSLVCCSPWGRKVGHDWATELNCLIMLCWFLLYNVASQSWLYISPPSWNFPPTWLYSWKCSTLHDFWCILKPNWKF